MSDEELFVKSVHHLQSLTRLNAHSYELLAVPVVLRRLLLDGNSPLVTRVNKDLRFPLTFRVARMYIAVAHPAGSVFVTREFVDPDAAVAATMAQEPLQDRSGKRAVRDLVTESVWELDLRDFLGFVVARPHTDSDRPRLATVLDLINYYAYTTGALHRGSRSNHPLLSALPPYRPDAARDLDLVEEMVVGVGRVVVRALLPLILAIEGNYQRPWASGDLLLEIFPKSEQGGDATG